MREDDPLLTVRAAAASLAASKVGEATAPPATADLLTSYDRARLDRILEDGTRRNTLRAVEGDFRYINAWRLARYGEALEWPERIDVASAFILDHSDDLSSADHSDPARIAADLMCRAGVRRSLAAPKAATLDRRIATWRTLHRRQNLASPFSDRKVAELLRTARRASKATRKPLSANPITIDVLERLIAALPRDLRGLRDGAMFAFAFQTGGRRVSEISALTCEMMDRSRFASDRVIPFRLGETKTTEDGETPALAIRGRAADLVDAWLTEAAVTSGPVFRGMTKWNTVRRRALSPRSIEEILKKRLVGAGFPADYATPHGFRSGFLTEAGRQGKNIGDAMALSLHRTVRQASEYYRAGTAETNEAGDMF